MRSRRPPLPPPRGPVTAQLFRHLLAQAQPLPPMPAPEEDPLAGDDAQLALYCCYELHYQGFDGVSDDWEWEPSLLAFRASVEQQFLEGLRSQIGPTDHGGDVVAALRALIGGSHGRSLSTYMVEHGTLEQFQEFAVHRSAYQLKEADAHTWGIPRLRDGAKASLIEIQLDEYGRGIESEMHSTLFATTMAGLGLDPWYGAYLHLLPGTTLATVNLVSLFGLHRRWRGALAGHLAVFETTSVGPMSRYSGALRRLGVGAASERFYDVHVEVDAHHEVVACKGLAGGLALAEPHLVADILFGAKALLFVEGRLTDRLLDAWAAGGSSLLGPIRPGEALSA